MSTPTLENALGVAIIGMAGRFPGARDIDQFWDNIQNGVNSLSRFSDEELLASNIAPELLRHPDFIKAGYILDDVELFDAGFFNISHGEAEYIDPQQRLFLECAWQAMENAGYVPGTGDAVVGVFASAAFSTYFLNLFQDFSLAKPTRALNVLLGNDKDYLASRVSYKLNLRGPAVLAQTACSSSLVGICMACQALMEYQVDMALAGGVSVDIPSKHGFLHQAADGAISRDCLCRAFDAEASGVATGNGLGILVLKRLQDALEDRDTIHAVIRGFATNNDGSDKVGFTAPSVRGQREAIAEAVAMADVSPATIGYVETHGTGTVMGDPIEIQALTAGYDGTKLPRQSCAIGSVKTNVGHLNAAAGVASAIKAALCLRDAKQVPSLHFHTPNPAIDFENGPFYVNTRLVNWQGGDTPRRAGVSSFGLGGNNAHIIMEEPPRTDVSDAPPRQWHLLPLSARSESALETASHRLRDALERIPDADLFHAAHTLQNGRTPFPHRKAILCRDRQDAIRILTTGDPKHTLFSRAPVGGSDKSVAFLFPGAGTQYAGMGAELYAKEPVFREAVDHCGALLAPRLESDIRQVLYPGPDASEKALAALSQPMPGLPAIFVTEYALAALWRSWGVRPRAMLGHSLGEYVAATLAGVFSLEDALTLVACRAALMENVPEGAMLVALACEETLREFLGDALSLGAVNGPSLCMVSGPVEAMTVLQRQLKENRIGFRPLASGRAGHSAMVEPIMEDFRRTVSRVARNAPEIPFLSNVTGDWITPEQATDPEYWVQHLRGTVRFSQGLAKLLETPDTLLLELGPGQGLKTLAGRHPDMTDAHHVVASMRDARQTDPDLLVCARALGSLWLAGLDVDWKKAMDPQDKGRRIPLPTYPFERQRYAITPKPGQRQRTLEEAAAKRPDIAEWFYAPSWKRALSHRAWRGPVSLAERETWLVFTDIHGLGKAFVGHLSRSGQDVVEVRAGDCFDGSGGTFTIHPGHQEDYDALLRRLAESGQGPQRIVHLWNISPDDQVESGLAYYEAVQDLGYNSLIYLMRAITAVNLGGQDTQLTVVSTNLQAVTGAERLSPEKSTLLGPCRVIPNEFPAFRCKNVDIELPDTGADLSRLARLLLGECTASQETFREEKTVAYRGRHRWIQDFTPIPLQAEAGKTPPFRDRGVYLITGGLGGVGYVLAEHLAGSCHPRLALLGRTRLPKRQDWERWLAEHDQDDRTSEALTKALRLEKLGAEILPLSADVSSPEEMGEAWQRIVDHFGPIHGIIHAAGVEGGGMIELRDLADTDSNANAKIRGTLVLEALSRDTPLDFCILCSSLVSFIGSVGGVDYASANIFLDTFANARARDSRQGIMAVNWDYWANIGMGRAIFKRHRAVFGETLDKLVGEDMAEAIAPHEGADAFNRLLSTAFPQVVVSTRDLPALLANLQKTAGAMRTVFDQANLEAKAHPRPRLSSPHAAPGNETERIILAAWEDVLGIEGLGVNDPYFELGGDSLHAMPLVARLREAFGIEIPLRIVYSHGTVAEMARFVAESRQANEQPADADDVASTRTVPRPMPTPSRVHPNCAADSAGS